MTVVNQENYICRRTTGGKPGGRPQKGRTPKNASFRNWWTIMGNSCLSLGTIKFPKEFIGKRVKFRVEIVDPPKKKEDLYTEE